MNFTSWLSGLNRQKTSRKRLAPKSNVASAETVESRQLLSVSALFIPASGELSIQLDSNDDLRLTAVSGNVQVEVATAGGPFVVNNSIGSVPVTSVLAIDILGGDDANSIDLSGVSSVDFTGNPTISVDAANGNDSIIGSPDLADNIIGGNGNDTINGQGGNDTLTAGDGDDVVIAGPGDDSIRGGDGRDSITGDAGNDAIDTGNGDDTVSGGDGNDLVYAGNGQDSITGDAGNDSLNGDGGTDTVDGGTGDDSILGGELNDSLLGGAGNDTVNGQAGNDTISGGLGDDNLIGAVGNDSVQGDDGNDILNGGMGADTMLGNNGNDTILGGADDDSLFGDGPDETSLQTGNDSINGQAGNDVIIGGRGTDTLIGGDGQDLVQSFFTSAQAPVAPPIVPPTQPATPTLAGGVFPDATDSGLGTVTTSQNATLQIGSGDGSLIQDTNATGHFGFANLNNSIYDPIGAILPASASFDSTVYIRQGVNGGTGVRQALSTAATNTSNIRLNGTTEANSTFTIGTLQFALTQAVQTTTDLTGNISGSLLIQTYRITNTGAANADFEMLRYYDGDLRFDGTLVDGGGRLVTNAGDEILFETDAGGTSASTTFVGITSKGGTVPAAGRYDIDQYPLLQTNIQAGTALRDRITNDANLDGSIDAGTDYDVTLGLRNLYSIAAGGSAIYTTHTIFGSGVPAAVLPPNLPPVATPDTGTSPAGGPVTVDVVSNDSDPDGVINYSTVQIASQPTNGTAVSLGNGLVTYTPNLGFNGTDTFTYIVADNRGTFTSPTTVAITVIGADNTGDLLAGSAGDDTLLGSFGNDTLNGQAGNDSLLGGGGNDSLLGGAGNDTLDGQAGNDTLNGQSGNDSLLGGDGNDVFTLDAAGSGTDSADGNDGFNTIQVTGTNAADAIAVGSVDGAISVNLGAGTILATANIQAAIVDALGGNDTVTISNIAGVAALNLDVRGGAGNDLLNATGANIGRLRLSLSGNAGNDTINGSNGNDTIDGGSGDDFESGFAGNDTILGGSGDDSIGGGLGDDSIFGGDGVDSINGQQGDDKVDGGAGNDSIKGDVGNDTLFGGAGDDNLNGMAGNDSILGGVGQDMINGGIGNDTLDGGRNDDTINGNAGDDKIRGDHGNDYITTGDGNNTVNGGDGDDTIITGAGNDFINGGDGNDRINANGGDDVIVGGDGNDTILGGAGNDTILGGDGNDSIDGQGGTDTLAGQQGADTIADPVAEIHELFVLSTNITDILKAL